MVSNSNTHDIKTGQTYLGIELGSTRIKIFLLNSQYRPLAVAAVNWQDNYQNQFWTYDTGEALGKVQECYLELKNKVFEQYGVVIKQVNSIGISGMMHGFLVLDEEDILLTPYRTWKNTNTTCAAPVLTELFEYNVPLRWSIAHLYQSILDGESFVNNIDYMTTLSGFVHYMLTGKKVLGIGDASGMFPIDFEKKNYDLACIKKFQTLLDDRDIKLNIIDVLPEVLIAGRNAGYLSESGAKLLDPYGDLQNGVPFAPPEGDAGTGMVATNSINIGTGNISAGTSIFAMIVLDKKLSKVYPEIDIVSTPDGSSVAMIHCNNCSSSIDDWILLFKEVFECLGIEIEVNELYTKTFLESLNGALDAGGVLSYNFLADEPLLGEESGLSMTLRRTKDRINLANLIKAEIYTAFCGLRIGMQYLKNENIIIRNLAAHGGLFKTPGVAQRYLSAAMALPITITDISGEGGAFGMALLAAYLVANNSKEMNLQNFLDGVFESAKRTVYNANSDEVVNFNKYLSYFEKGLPITKKAFNELI